MNETHEARRKAALAHLVASKHLQAPNASRVALAYLEGHAKQGGWFNYNTQGRRPGISIMLSIMETMTPAVMAYLPATDPAYAPLKKKWWSKGRTINERAVKGKLILWKGKRLFLGMVGGKEMAVAGPGWPR